MSSMPIVYYAQGLAGDRWRFYSSWSRFVPGTLLDKIATRWPARLIWRGDMSCGAKAVKLQIYGGAGKALEWREKLSARAGQNVVCSSNLPALVQAGMSLPAGRLLLACCLRQAISELSKQMRLEDDSLTVGIAARGSEMACWFANVEGMARQVTILTDRRSRLLPLATSGLVPRQLDLTARSLDVNIFIVSPELLPLLSKIDFSPGTILIRTDGVLIEGLPGFASVGLDCGRLPFPDELLANKADVAPLLETILLAAQFGQPENPWPLHWSARLALVQQAISKSEWTFTWQLANANALHAILRACD